MSSLLTGALAYGSSVFIIFALYPYRDLVKSVDVRHLPAAKDLGYYFAKRYRGMLGSPSQPMMLAAPHAALYFGYVFAAGGATGCLLGGFLLGYTKTFVRTVAHRMNGADSRYRKLGQRGYSGLLDCIVLSMKHYGVLSFFPGALAASAVGVLWHGISLAVLQQTRSRSFGEDFWNAFRIHALLTFLTAPMRNTVRSSTYHSERPGGVHALRGYVAAEVTVFREAAGVFRSSAQEEGLRFFFNGVLRTTFKSSVPFALTYSLFKFMGGSIGLPSGRTYRGAHSGRHFSRRL
ncbi:hypothetical protein LSCM1_00773 [Leishmania martiniquensis]|uniref:Mitochondrial carrier protein n=1 Tax=Leishmania martiniquensis TaxID=1580590 RepID=A0A836GMJ8_9TRYP|nr:hypothetical protein LSCM1_00773 [Leishmania martiniquensis]